MPGNSFSAFTFARNLLDSASAAGIYRDEHRVGGNPCVVVIPGIRAFECEDLIGRKLILDRLDLFVGVDLRTVCSGREVELRAF